MFSPEERAVLDETTVTLRDKSLPSPARHFLHDVIIDDSGLK